MNRDLTSGAEPNLLVDVPGSITFPEQAWVGKTLAIGSVALRIDTTCPRCAMTARGFDLPQDPQIMRLVANSEGNLGIYASVVKVGKVATGDPVNVMWRLPAPVVIPAKHR